MPHGLNQIGYGFTVIREMCNITDKKQPVLLSLNYPSIVHTKKKWECHKLSQPDGLIPTNQKAHLS
ncbi:MAG: hypothetical protein H0W89_08195 [Candidatus Levybacteria bacterium]|nr:hypothetical protein [Candidatus Levybacteria bacterium]